MSRPISPEQYEPSWQEPDSITCPDCKGDGTVRDFFDLDITCPNCNGEGGLEL